MPFNGSGVYSPVAAPDFPAVPTTTIRASQYNTQINDIAAALTNCVTRDGQGAATADIPMGGNKITGLGAAIANGQAVRYDEFVTVVAGQTHAATSKAAPVDADELPLVDSAASFALKKLTIVNLLAKVWSALGGLIAGGTSKATIVDGDGFPIADSAASNATKYTTWANIKPLIKAYIEGVGLLVSAAVGMGYTTGSGGTVTQATSKTTAVTLNKPTGQITTHNASLASAATAVFTVNNSLASATDTVIINISGGVSGYDNYLYWVRPIAGGFNVIIYNRTAGALAESIVFNFAVIKGAIA